jgi:hypothetical protein
VKLFVDEDTGSGIAQALIANGIAEVEYVGPGRAIERGTLDVDWLPYIGRNGYLLLSRNKAILRVPAERRLFISHQVGAVFLPGRKATAEELLHLVLGRLAWLEEIDRTEPRPFAFVLYRTGGYGRRVLLP